MSTVWNKGQTKETHPSLAKTSATMRAKGINNFKKWRDEKITNGLIKSDYPELAKNADLAELIGVTLGDGHICRHERCESLRIVGNANSPGFAARYADIVERVFKKKPHVAIRNQENAINITIYEKYISTRLGIPAGDRGALEFELPDWISKSRNLRIFFLRGLYEAEGSLSFHAGTYTHKFIFSNKNKSLLDTVFTLVSDLGFHPHRSSRAIQVSRKLEVQNLADLLQFRHYEGSNCGII